jgi:alpha-tubulin suppressor-like RCC1 family protein
MLHLLNPHYLYTCLTPTIYTYLTPTIHILNLGSRQKSDKPALVEAFSALGTKAKWVSCGHQHTVILTAEGVVLSCGAGEYGVLGTGSTEDSTVPAPLDALLDEDIVHIAAGYDHTLALTATGKVYSWGRNGSGQLGHSDSFIDIYSMEDFPRLIDTESVKGGAENEDALRAAGLLNDKYVTFAQIAAGQSISAAITTEGLLFVWGARVGHQPKLIAPALLNNLRVKKVACGGGQRGSAFAILAEDGSLWMMGDSASKLLGVTGVRGKQPVPQKIPSLGDRVVDMSCGYGNHMVAFAKMVTTET